MPPPPPYPKRAAVSGWLDSFFSLSSGDRGSKIHFQPLSSLPSIVYPPSFPSFRSKVLVVSAPSPPRHECLDNLGPTSSLFLFFPWRGRCKKTCFGLDIIVEVVEPLFPPFPFSSSQTVLYAHFFSFFHAELETVQFVPFLFFLHSRPPFRMA